MLKSIIEAYGLSDSSQIQQSGNGLINNTWTLTGNTHKYLLQRINTNVFKDPHAIAHNIDAIGNYLAAKYPEYLFTTPVPALNGASMVFIEGEGYFRMFHFVEDSHSLDVVDTPEQAYEAAAQFGRFTRLLNEFDAAHLKTTIPDFHNLSLRHQQFNQALANGNPERINHASALIKTLQQYEFIVHDFEQITHNPEFRKRVTHHDTKISNVLFNENNKGLCVIDLDTIMPGYFISDVGDMMRTYLSPVSEEEKDFSKIEVRQEFYTALVQGYYDEMKEALTATEKEYFFYAGCFIIYMQALRFLTDYLNNDVYYGSRYEGHNFVRAGNQAVLLQKLIEAKPQLQNAISQTEAVTH